MSDSSELIRLMIEMRSKLAAKEGQRYYIVMGNTASKCLRRFSWPHKWRGPGRSMRHLKPVEKFINTLQQAINTPEVYANIDKQLDEWIAAGYPPWHTEANTTPELHNCRYVARISNLA